MGFSAARFIASFMRAVTEVRGTPSIGLPATLTITLPTTTLCSAACEPGTTWRMVTGPSPSRSHIPSGPGPKVTIRRKGE